MRTDDPETGDGPRADEEPVAPADPAEVTRLADRLLQGLGLEVRAEVRDTGEVIEVNIVGGDQNLLLARKGESLNATQYLLNRILYRGRKGRKIQVDSGGYRKLQENEIVENAVRSAEKARERGEEVVLSPLNPYERRLVHLALAEIEGVETRSIGDGFLKRVAIIPARRAADERDPKRD